MIDDSFRKNLEAEGFVFGEDFWYENGEYRFTEDVVLHIRQVNTRKETEKREQLILAAKGGVLCLAD